jgi:RHS repeat-associated protein
VGCFAFWGRVPSDSRLTNPYPLTAALHIWDYENRLTKIDNPPGDDYLYEYDGDGMRVRSGHDSGQGNVWDTRFYCDVGAPLYAYLFESDNNKNMTVAHTIDPDGNLISQRRGGATSYQLYDRLGSTRQLLDSSQTVTDHYDYYAFGEVRASSGSTTNPFKFIGQLGYYGGADSPLQYVRARYYSAQCGRFWTLDPIALGIDRAYAYASNSPTIASDPAGKKTVYINWRCAYQKPWKNIKWWSAVDRVCRKYRWCAQYQTFTDPRNKVAVQNVVKNVCDSQPPLMIYCTTHRKCRGIGDELCGWAIVGYIRVVWICPAVVESGCGVADTLAHEFLHMGASLLHEKPAQERRFRAILYKCFGVMW